MAIFNSKLLNYQRLHYPRNLRPRLLNIDGPSCTTGSSEKSSSTGSPIFLLRQEWNLESELWSVSCFDMFQHVSIVFNKQDLHLARDTRDISLLSAVEDLHTAASCLRKSVVWWHVRTIVQCSRFYMLHMFLLVPNGFGHFDFSGLVNFVPKWHFWPFICFWTNTRLAHQVEGESWQHIWYHMWKINRSHRLH